MFPFLCCDPTALGHLQRANAQHCSHCFNAACAALQVKMIVMLGELGGNDEYGVVEALKAKAITKPVVSSRAQHSPQWLCSRIWDKLLFLHNQAQSSWGPQSVANSVHLYLWASGPCSQCGQAAMASSSASAPQGSPSAAPQPCLYSRHAQELCLVKHSLYTCMLMHC